jgi:repressor LexA
MLTGKQKEMLLFLNEWIEKNGEAPTYDEIEHGLGRSRTAVGALIWNLEQRGFIHRFERRARSIQVLRLPASEARGTQPETALNPPVIRIPLMGRISARTPAAAIQTRIGTLAYPGGFLGGGEHFALEFRGDSLVDAGILQGDTLIFHKQDDAQAGDIVVALIDGEEAGLKRLDQRGGAIALEAANAEYKTRILLPERVQVQGKLVGLTRRY